VRKRPPDEPGSPPPGFIVSFHAALAGVGSYKKAITLDGEGQCVLSLEVPRSDAAQLVSAFNELIDRAFVVTITAD
jgi:hypothetical protein